MFLKTGCASKCIKHGLPLQPSGSGAGGSASGLGPEGRRFESCLPDVKRRLLGAFFFVIPARFERATVSLEVKCSVQLSYGTY